MTQAPATTVATAVRQHGGGRRPLNLPCTVLAGRLQDSRGGVINRRAEGATSSNTLPASCAAAAHPTTGVRRARELSPSLRSQSCQHAQLVEGYKAQLEPLDRLERAGCQVEKETRSLTVVSLLPLINLKEAFDTATKLNHRIDKTYVRQAHGVNRLNSRQSVVSRLNTASLRHIANQRRRPYSEMQYERCLIGTPCNQLHSANHNCSSFLPGTLLACPLIPDGVERGQHSSQASNRLSPIGCTIRYSPITRRAEYQPKQAAADQENPNSPKTPLPHFLGNHQARHPQQLLAESNRRSLPAPCHHVQRGAA
jgi:hypothetical protein